MSRYRVCASVGIDNAEGTILTWLLSWSQGSLKDNCRAAAVQFWWCSVLFSFEDQPPASSNPQRSLFPTQVFPSHFQAFLVAEKNLANRFNKLQTIPKG